VNGGNVAAIFQLIAIRVRIGTIIRRPRVNARVMEVNNAQRTIIYENVPPTYQKTITAGELLGARNILIQDGQFTLQWYKTNFPREAGNKPCNFTTIGGLFVLLRLARYERPGVYVSI